jgi:hypothetical protein
MSKLEIILSGITALSILFNVGVFLYARACVTRLLFVSEELRDLNAMINSFTNHVKGVYELDAFYGDATIQGLLQHAISFNEQMDTFEFIYGITEEEVTEPEEDAEPEEDYENTEKEVS